MSRLIKFTWFFTTLLFLAILLWTYAYLPANVVVGSDAGGTANEYLGRETYFYLSLIIFIFFNAILFGLKKLIDANIRKKDHIPNNDGKSLQHDLANWLLGFAAAINIFLSLASIYISLYNNREGVNLDIYGPVVYAGPVLIGILLLVLGYILLKKRS